MKLYTGDLSPYSARIRMQIYAKGIRDAFNFTLPPDFLQGKFYKTSPIGRIPVLELDDGSIIPESEVISEYIEEKFPEPSMLGATPEERANVRVLSRIADIYIMNNIFMSLVHPRSEHGGDNITGFLMEQMIRGLGALEKHIVEDGPFAAGDRITSADCALVPAIWMVENTAARVLKSSPIEGLPKVSKWWANIQKNDIAAKVIAEINAGLQRRLDGTEGQPGST